MGCKLYNWFLINFKLIKMNVTKVDLTTPTQKVFAGVLGIGILYGLSFIVPPLVVLFANIWLLVAMAIPLLLLVMNYKLVWNLLKQLSWNITKFAVSKNKIGFMYRYHDYLLSKIEKLDVSIKNIASMRIKTQRKIIELNDSLRENKSKVAKLQEKGASTLVIRTLSNKVTIDTKYLESLLPKVVNIENQEKYLKDLYSNWVADAEDLKYTLDAKAEEYLLLKEMSIASGTAKEFLNGSSEESKLFKESLNQIEESITKYTANVEDFERKAKPILEAMAVDRAVSEDEGLRLVEEFKKNSVDLKITS